MKKLLLTFAAVLLVSFFASAQKKYSVYAVGFYNRKTSSTLVMTRERKTMTSCLMVLIIGTD